MLSGKVNSALRLLSSTESSGILNVEKQTTELLLEKHPVGAEKYCEFLLLGPEFLFGEYAYDTIDGALIKKRQKKSKVQLDRLILIRMVGEECLHLRFLELMVRIYAIPSQQ